MVSSLEWMAVVDGLLKKAEFPDKPNRSRWIQLQTHVSDGKTLEILVCDVDPPMNRRGIILSPCIGPAQRGQPQQ